MPSIERMTITLPADMAAVVKAAVEAGDSASTSELVRDALRERKTDARSSFRNHRARGRHYAGLANVAASRVKDFDTKKIVERGRKLSGSRLLPGPRERRYWLKQRIA